MVTRLLKYLRNVWPCPLEELPSHVIKTVVMRTILAREKTYWRDNQKLEDNFRECFAQLVSSVKDGRVEDVLWGVNILPVKIKNRRTLQFISDALDTLKQLLDN